LELGVYQTEYKNYNFMKLYCYLVLLCATLFYGCNNEGQVLKHKPEKNIPVGAVALNVVRNRIVISSIVNETKCKLEFDTGFPGGGLTELFSKKINASIDSESGLINNIKSMIIGGDTVKFPKLTLYEGRMKYDGLLGFNIKRELKEKRIWEFSISKNYLKIWDNDSCLNYVNMVRMPFYIDDRWNVLVVQPQIDFCGDNEMFRTNYKYLFDTGTPFFCCITKDLDNLDMFLKHQSFIDKDIPPKFINITYNLAGFCYNQDTINSGSFELIRTPFGPRNTDFYGTLGVEFIKHYDFIIDFNRKEILLSRNNIQYSNSEYRINNMGFDIQKSLSSDEYKVLSISKKSNAEKSGIKLGDVLLSINGNNVITDELIDSTKRVALNETITTTVKRGTDTLRLIFKATKNYRSEW
jgi:hypothetical protein